MVVKLFLERFSMFREFGVRAKPDLTPGLTDYEM